MPLDTAWALAEIETFLQLTLLSRPSYGNGSRAGSEDSIIAAASVTERIFDRVLPYWRSSIPDKGMSGWDRWDRHVEAAHRVRALLSREAEIREKLGDDAPQLDANKLHPWIWDGARSLWRSGHYREAVGAAAIKLNAEAQNKIGRTDVAETNLFNQAFSTNTPKPGESRLRLTPDDGSPTFTSLHRGVRCFAEGCFAAIRNPISHRPGELPEDEALEQLAALSVLARWVDTATLER